MHEYGSQKSGIREVDLHVQTSVLSDYTAKESKVKMTVVQILHGLHAVMWAGEGRGR